MMKTTLLALALGGLVAGCAPFVDEAQQIETVESVGIVKSIDRTNRRLEVLADGEIVTLRVNEQVANFDQIELNDRINVAYTEGVAVEMALPTDAGDPEGLTAVATAEEGEKPALVGIDIETFVVEFVAYDPRDKSATVLLNDGTLDRIWVPREFRGFARSRLPGDRIVISTEQALAISVDPAG